MIVFLVKIPKIQGVYHVDFDQIFEQKFIRAKVFSIKKSVEQKTYNQSIVKST